MSNGWKWELTSDGDGGADLCFWDGASGHDVVIKINNREIAFVKEIAFGRDMLRMIDLGQFLLDWLKKQEAEDD